MSNTFNNLYEFDEYVLDVRERSLHRNEKLIPLPPKVFDTLRLLVEKHGELVSKQEMLDTIWKDAFVEENNLSQNISALRRIFGKDNKFIGNAASYTQPAVSPDDLWLFYVKRKKGKASIWRKSLDNSQKELVLKVSGYSPQTFLSISPEGKYLESTQKLE